MLELNKIYNMDCLKGLKQLDDNSINCCVTSPPYWGLRDYGVEGQLGLESTPEEYVTKMVEIFREVKRVLRDDGTLWLNLGDSYSGSCQTGGVNSISGNGKSQPHVKHKRNTNLKPKDLVGIPWRVALHYKLMVGILGRILFGTNQIRCRKVLKTDAQRHMSIYFF